MAKNKQTSQQADSEHSEVPNQTAGDLEQRPFDPTRSKEEGKIYDEAMAQNREREFVTAIMDARKPPEQKEYVAPEVPPGIAAQTKLEMAAGAKRVMEFASQEIQRQEAHERHKRDKWADKESIPVFRPDDYVPDQKKGQGNIVATSAPLKD